jgi:arylsulfatase A-like enzyme
MENAHLRPTRREFIQAAGASAAAGAAVTACSREPSYAARRPDGPNVVVIIIDTLRADHVYGDRARTPNMDFLLREGLRFTRAFPEAMPTVPARNSILGGRRMFPFRGWHDYPGLLMSPGWSPIPSVEKTFTSYLRRAGYWTAYVTDNPFLGYSSPYERLQRSFDLFIRHGGQIGVAKPPSSVSRREVRHWLHPKIRDRDHWVRLRRYLANGRYWHDDTHSFAARVFRSGATALEQAVGNAPFALIVDTYEPHEPWTPPRRYINEYGDPDYRGPEPSMPRYRRVSNWLEADERDFVLGRLRALYAAEVTMTDRWLGVFLDRLHELRLERETVIVLVADHGIQLGEHGWTGKISIALHPVLTRVPLVLVDPERRLAGSANDYFASTHDVGPTLLQIAGVRKPEIMTGVDLSRFLRGRRPPERPLAYGGYRNNHYVRTDRWAYMSDNRMLAPRLFDLSTDPDESRNVAERHPGVVNDLQEALTWRAGGRPPYYDV